MPTNRKGYIAEYYHREREKIIQQLGGKCIACGVTDNLHIHHIRPYNGKNHRGRGAIARLLEWKKNIDNITLLCQECHKEYHMLYDPDINERTLKEYIEGLQCRINSGSGWE